MADADDQWGGTGDERGHRPEDPSEERLERRKKAEDEAADRDSNDSFPASDPPATY
jgi:hypothetical protein